MRLRCLLTMLALLSPAAVLAGNTESEIEYLIASIGDSNCTFVRNGSRHDAEDAEDHLRMKYRRGKRYATSAELFIERLASKSSMSGKLYTMECPDSETVPSGEWLTARLHEYRAQVSNSQ
ncbi:MAG: DUF5329 domain-containing protein [Gammaproteobacteria bacterium]|nr:DUF5329 domain-containing protein [Gammaproteobacteria bacterium]MDH3756446.1 DUF5329 domain-containing protein [Gammaproteobacteria bacterium]MDH3848300.1 DUF5329 domain-containing protein [Gammaproteobacteria bacterium]MDH3863124.1 DUF5329 domain-containing protein [Gammaproteobacteria bacterium]MDH3905263.1 DUF5329 domain-containing protein [Gammaproteobacteria bacterium]